MVVTRHTIIALIVLGSVLVSLYLLSFLSFYQLQLPLIHGHSQLSTNDTSFPVSHHPTRPRRLHHLLPIDAKAALSSSTFCKTLVSALVHGYEPIILNWEKEGDTALLHRMKVAGVYDYLTNLTDPDSESDLVFMTDALDVWFQLSPSSLIARFEELNTTGVVVGAEKACWPNEWESPACQDVPESPLPKGTYGFAPEPENSWSLHTRPRWANSGVVIGPVTAMRELYKDLLEIFRDPIFQENNLGDQGPFNEMLAAGRVSLDYRSRLFWQTAAAHPRDIAHFLNTPYHVDSAIPHELYPPLLHLTPTGEIPAVIHFNDRAEKTLLDDWWGKFWWNKLQGDDTRFEGIVRSRLENAVVSFAENGTHREAWTEICPKLLNQ